MAAVPVYPLVYQSGDSLTGLSWQWKDENGVAKNIVGYTAALTIFKADQTVVLTLTHTAGLVVDGVNGKVSVVAPPALLTALVAGNYTYTIQVISNDLSIAKTFTLGDFRVDGIPTNE